MKEIMISEIFGPTIQGEGALIGRPTIFVRVGGCDYKCNWCDTLYAVLPKYKPKWMRMTPEAILKKVQIRCLSKPIWITLSGGNPALYDGLSDFAVMAQEKGHKIALETQGSMPKGWFTSLDHLILSPKPPSSGMPTDYDKLERCLNFGAKEVSIKIVIFTEDDLKYAMEMAEWSQQTIYVQVGNNSINDPDVGPAFQQDTFDKNEQRSILLGRLESLVRDVLEERRYDLVILPQLHTLLWGNERGK